MKTREGKAWFGIFAAVVFMWAALGIGRTEEPEGTPWRTVNGEIEQWLLAKSVSAQEEAQALAAKPNEAKDVRNETASGGDSSFSAALDPDGRLVDLNRATLEELDALPGIGPAKAQAILNYRETNGPFRSKEELLNVRGIGPAIFEKLLPLVTVSEKNPSSD